MMEASQCFAEFSTVCWYQSALQRGIYIYYGYPGYADTGYGNGIPSFSDKDGTVRYIVAAYHPIDRFTGSFLLYV